MAEIKPELLASHKIFYPAIDEIGETPLAVIQGTIKKEKLNHVVYTCSPEDCGGGNKKRYFTIYRSKDLEEALDFCRRCEECRVLFRLFGEWNENWWKINTTFILDDKKDIRKTIWDVTYMVCDLIIKFASYLKINKTQQK